jgi:type III pantothenate kinase
MLLAIDVGNTNIVLGVFEGNQVARSWRLATYRERTADELGMMTMNLLRHAGLEPGRIDGVILASVVPPLTGMMRDMVTRYFGWEPLSVDGTTATGMPVLYEPPGDVGADRIVNGVAAYELYGRPRGAPVIVVDFGTATTFDAITARGEYLGGVICPGIQISADALFQRAARLPRVDVRKPASVIGRTTVGSMQAGLFFGYVDMVDGLVRRMREELAATSAPPAVCVATGGMAGVLSSETAAIEEVNPDLTLIGLRMIWERNR